MVLMNSETQYRRTRVKFCGITRVEDALAAVELGVDAVGCVCYPPSARAVSSAQAAQITAVLPPWVLSVALFVNPAVDAVNSVIQTMQPSMLQFHGDEPEVFCKQFGLPYIKAFHVNKRFDDNQCLAYASADSLLFDTCITGAYGGTGHAFDWSLFPQARYCNLRNIAQMHILAGGLTPDNLCDAIRIANPDVVDVSSGIELKDQPGLKDIQRMRAFMRALKSQ